MIKSREMKAKLHVLQVLAIIAVQFSTFLSDKASI